MQACVKCPLQAPAEEVLVGVEAIAAHLKRSPRLVRRWIRAGQLQVRLIDGAYMATRTQLNAWISGKE